MHCEQHQKTRRGNRFLAVALTAVIAPVGISLTAATAANAAGSGWIGDTVWYDLNANGIQDPGEPGAEGIRVTLIGPDGWGNESTTTGADGSFKFQLFETGEHALQFEGLPEGAQFTEQSVGDDESVDSNANSSGRTDVFNVESLDDVIDHIDAGIIDPQAPAPVYGSIGDRVWQDSNMNGIQDAGEWDAPGINVALHDASGAIIARDQTDGNGNYLFKGLEAGTYYVSVSGLSEGWVLSPPGRGGDPERDSNMSPTSGRSGAITLTAGASTNSVDAGIYFRG